MELFVKEAFFQKNVTTITVTVSVLISTVGKKGAKMSKRLFFIYLSLLLSSSCATYQLETKVVKLKNCKRVSLYWDYCQVERGGDPSVLVEH